VLLGVVTLVPQTSDRFQVSGQSRGDEYEDDDTTMGGALTVQGVGGEPAAAKYWATWIEVLFESSVMLPLLTTAEMLPCPCPLPGPLWMMIPVVDEQVF
jgi:hypothetical protein